LLECILGAVCETWVRLIRMKLLTVVGDAGLQPRREPKPTVRKPRGERRPVPKGKPLKSANNLPKKGEMKFRRPG
jgi:hypothetical protein